MDIETLPPGTEGAPATRANVAAATAATTAPRPEDTAEPMRGVSGPPAPTEDARAGSAAPATTPMEGVSGLSASGPAPPSPAPTTQGASSYSSDEGSIDGSGGDESDGDVGLDSALPPPPPPPRLTDEGINKLWRDFMEEQDMSLAQGQTTDLLTHRVGDLYRLLRSHFVQLRKVEHRYVDVRDAMAKLAKEKMPALIDLLAKALIHPRAAEFDATHIFWQKLACALHNMLAESATGFRYALAEFTPKPEHRERWMRMQAVTVSWGSSSWGSSHHPCRISPSLLLLTPSPSALPSLPAHHEQRRSRDCAAARKRERGRPRGPELGDSEARSGVG